MLSPELVKQFYTGEIDKKVTPRNIHCDWFSRERGTGVTKKKYLLLTRRSLDLDVFLFYALTSKESSCPKRAKVQISSSDYENKESNHLSGPCSFINLEKVAVESTDDIIQKMRDQSNEFLCVAKITQQKFQEIKSSAPNFKNSPYIVDEEVRKLVRSALHDEDISADFVARFGI